MSRFGSAISIDSSNGLITLSNKTDVIASVGNNSYGGLYLSGGTGAFIDGNVYIARNVKIGGTAGGNQLTVASGTSSFVDVIASSLSVNGNISASSILTVYGASHFKSNMDVSANVDISGNLRVTNGSIYVDSGIASFVTVNVSQGLNVTGASRFKSNMDISANVDISGNLIVRGNITGTLVPPSDYRIKTNVKLLSDTSFNIDQLVPKYYYNTIVKNQEIGFIAHEIQEEYPFLVAGVKDGPEIQGVNYTGLIGLLVKEIQDLKSRVSQLESYTVTD
jgi:cytoskeletal protein CcmA (bactofilin family)